MSKSNPNEVRYEPIPPPKGVPASTPRTGAPVNPLPPRPKGK